MQIKSIFFMMVFVLYFDLISAKHPVKNGRLNKPPPTSFPYFIDDRSYHCVIGKGSLTCSSNPDGPEYYFLKVKMRNVSNLPKGEIIRNPGGPGYSVVIDGEFSCQFNMERLNCKNEHPSGDDFGALTLTNTTILNN